MIIVTGFEDAYGCLEPLSGLLALPENNQALVIAAVKKLKARKRQAAEGADDASATHQQRGLRTGTSTERVARAVGRELAGIKKNIVSLARSLRKRGLTLHAQYAAVAQGAGTTNESTFVTEGSMAGVAEPGYFATGEGSRVIAADPEASGVDVLLSCCRAAAAPVTAGGAADQTPPIGAGWCQAGVHGMPSRVRPSTIRPPCAGMPPPTPHGPRPPAWLTHALPPPFWMQRSRLRWASSLRVPHAGDDCVSGPGSRDTLCPCDSARRKKHMHERCNSNSAHMGPIDGHSHHAQFARAQAQSPGTKRAVSVLQP